VFLATAFVHAYQLLSTYSSNLVTLFLLQTPLQASAAIKSGTEDESSMCEAQIHAIEDTFEAARQPPVHQTKPDLKPVEILPGAVYCISLTFC
jgi:hypothetical protein